MKRVIDFLARCWKYHLWIATIIFVLAVGFFADYSFLNLFQLWSRERALKAQIEKYEKLYVEDSTVLATMDSSPEAIEKVARVNLLMKNDNEDVYIVVEE